MTARLSRIRPRAVKGVLFDLDGTLVDSEFLSPLAWTAVLKEVGVDISEGCEGGVQDIEKALTAPELRGTNAADVAHYLIQKFNISSENDPLLLVKRKRALAVEIVANGEVDLEPLWFKDTTRAIRRLEKVVGSESVGLCTSNLRSIVLAILEAGNLGDSFRGGKTVQEDVIDHTGLPQMKPRPDPYLLALNRLNIDPKSVVALEDSAVGVASALSAGVGTVLGVLNREDNETKESKEAENALLAAGADEVFQTTVDAIDWCIASAQITQHQDEITSSMKEKEEVVRRYFDGVNKKDPAMMASCFADTVELRDMCGPSKGEPRMACSKDMADRCMEFLAAHPDCRVEFEQPPICDREGQWVWCHWVESGHWTGESRDVEPKNTELSVGGQTRFFLEKTTPESPPKILKQVIYRTFSEWELSL
eukprot:scaffold331_cov117-Cylindrotheca_fusiformis.AAC.3